MRRSKKEKLKEMVITFRWMTKDQRGRNLKIILRNKRNMLHLDSDNSKWPINQLNLKETILTVEEFNQKDKLLLRMPLSNTSNRSSNNNRTRRDMSNKCKNYNKSNNNRRVRSRDKPKWLKNNTMLCNRIRICSSYKFKKEVAQVQIEESRALVIVNNNRNKTNRKNQAEENLKLLQLQVIHKQILSWLKLRRANRQLSINKLKTNICNSKFKNNWCEPQPKTKIGSSAPNANMKSDEKHSF